MNAEIVDQVGDPIGEHAGLARTRPGNDQHRAIGRGHCLALRGIQIIEQGRARNTEVFPHERDGTRVLGQQTSLRSLLPKTDG